MIEEVIISYDCGNEETGWVVYNVNTKKLLYKNKEKNEEMFKKTEYFISNLKIKKVGLEYPSSYGMPVNQTLLDTCTIIGILIEKFKKVGIETELIFRKTVKMHLCGSVRAKDGAVNSRVQEKFGFDHTIKKPNDFYWNENIEKYGGARYCQNDQYAALAVLCYMIEPHDIPIKNEKEQEKNKISKELQYYLDM